MHIIHNWSEWMAYEIYPRYSRGNLMWYGYKLKRACDCGKEQKSEGTK